MRDDLALTLESSGDLTRLDEAVALTAYRVVQKSLTNIYRHSSATWAKVSVSLERPPAIDGKPAEETDRLRIIIEDNGIGFSSESGKGLGLLGMTERVKALDGEISIAERASGGTRIDVDLPAPLEKASAV